MPEQYKALTGQSGKGNVHPNMPMSTLNIGGVIMAKGITKWTVDYPSGSMTCTIAAINKTMEFDVSTVFPDWESYNEVQKHCIITGLKPKMEDSTAKNADLKQTPQERYAQISNMWDRLTVSQEWSTKREREESIQKKLSNMKVLSVSMVKAAPLLGLKIDPAAKILSDEEYAQYLIDRDSEDSDN
jgi:hypothetical protein